MRISKRTLALALALVTMLLLAAPALAASEQMYATTGLNVRKGPGTSYAIVGELSQGEVVTVTSRTGNWAYITYGSGAKGYASLSYLKSYTGSSSTGVSGTAMYVTGAVNVRKGPSTSYAKVGELAKGDTVIKVGATGSWTIIEWSGGTAYVSSSYLSATNPGGSTGSGSIKMQATTAVNVRKGPGTGYAIVGSLDKGDTVYATGVYSGNWTQVTYNSAIAYVSTSYLKTVSAGSTSSGTTMYCNTQDTRVYDRASTSSTVRGYLDRGQAVTVLSTSGYWSAIQFGSRVCYVRNYYLTESEYSTTAKTGTVYALSSVRVYSGPGTRYSSLGYLYSGETAQRTGVTGSWTQIEFNGKTGYVTSSQVKAVSTTSMTRAGYYMYAENSKTYAYSIPTASSRYELGYYRKGEPVWVVAYNSSWAQVTHKSSTMYVQTKYLSEEPLSSSSSSGSLWWDEEYYEKGDVIKLPKGTPIYSGKKFSSWDSDLKTATWVYVSSVSGDWLRVYDYYDDSYIGYINIEDL